MGPPRALVAAAAGLACARHVPLVALLPYSELSDEAEADVENLERNPRELVQDWRIRSIRRAYR